MLTAVVELYAAKRVSVSGKMKRENLGQIVSRFEMALDKAKQWAKHAVAASKASKAEAAAERVRTSAQREAMGGETVELSFDVPPNWVRGQTVTVESPQAREQTNEQRMLARFRCMQV